MIEFCVITVVNMGLHVVLLPYALHTASLLFPHVYMLPSLQSSVQETYTRRVTTCLAAGSSYQVVLLC